MSQGCPECGGLTQHHSRYRSRAKYPLEQGSAVRMPSEDEMRAFNRGKEAYGRGSPEHANPYQDVNPNLESFWSFGWAHAQVESRKEKL